MAKYNMDLAEKKEYVHKEVSDGSYICKITKITETINKNDECMWFVSFKIDEGEFSGEYLKDSFTFNEKWGWRLKLLLHRAGIETPSGEFEYKPEVLTDRYVLVTIKGKKKEQDGTMSPAIAINGYDSIDDGSKEQKTENAENDLKDPFA
jgi:hypothetical protein